MIELTRVPFITKYRDVGKFQIIQYLRLPIIEPVLYA